MVRLQSRTPESLCPCCVLAEGRATGLGVCVRIRFVMAEDWRSRSAHLVPAALSSGELLELGVGGWDQLCALRDGNLKRKRDSGRCLQMVLVGFWKGVAEEGRALSAETLQGG